MDDKDPKDNVAKVDEAAARSSNAAPEQVKKPDAEPAKKPDAETAAKDRELEDSRHDNVRVVNPRAPEAVARQHEEVDAALEKRNDENREGHDKNMAAIEHTAAEAQGRTAHADDPRARHVPTGKEQNRNTPRVLPDGTKVWDT